MLENPEKPQTVFALRPTEAEKRLVAAARKLIGITTSQLLRRCLHKAIGQVIAEAKEVRADAEREFNDALAASLAEDQTIPTTKPKSPKPPKRK